MSRVPTSLRVGFFGVVLVVVAIPRMACAQTLHDAVEGAWKLDPEIQGLEARRSEFIARRTAAGSFFPGPPTVTLDHATDQVLVNRNQRVSDGELSTPLWLPGEGTATEQVADADLNRTDAQIALAKLKVAGEVRDSVYAYALAEAEAGLARRRLANAEALEADVARRVRAGETAAVEEDLVRGDFLDAQAGARAQEALAAAARASLLSLTGVPAPPRSYAEPLSPASQFARHPRIQAANRAADAARAEVRLAQIATRDNPEVGVFASRNRDIFGTVNDWMLGVRLKVPFPSETRNAPRKAAAAAELTAALAAGAAAERAVRLDLANARRELTALEAQTPLIRARLQAVQSAVGRLRRSYDAGEIGLFDLLRGQATLFEAEIAETRNRIEVGRARARVNQALGMVP
jgi:outer membrane protein TolC